FDVILRETLPALQKVVDAGKARYIGIADYDLDLMKAIVEESEVPIAAVLSYAKSTLLDNRLEEYIPYFKSEINALQLTVGLKASPDARVWHLAGQMNLCSSSNTEDCCPFSVIFLIFLSRLLRSPRGE
ncbi:jg18151, partial [Pararge aegeria aegeria]